jgi:hypothetical protein
MGADGVCGVNDIYRRIADTSELPRLADIAEDLSAAGLP